MAETIVSLRLVLGVSLVSATIRPSLPDYFTRDDALHSIPDSDEERPVVGDARRDAARAAGWRVVLDGRAGRRRREPAPARQQP